jgi:hypothetical protein
LDKGFFRARQPRNERTPIQKTFQNSKIKNQKSKRIWPKKNSKVERSEPLVNRAERAFGARRAPLIQLSSPAKNAERFLRKLSPTPAKNADRRFLRGFVVGTTARVARGARNKSRQKKTKKNSSFFTKTFFFVISFFPQVFFFFHKFFLLFFKKLSSL